MALWQSIYLAGMKALGLLHRANKQMEGSWKGGGGKGGERERERERDGSRAIPQPENKKIPADALTFIIFSPILFLTHFATSLVLSFCELSMLWLALFENMFFFYCPLDIE